MSLAKLDAVLKNTDSNKNDRVITLIQACIGEGINEGRAIVSQLVQLGYDPVHVRIQLSKNAGPLPSNKLWERGDNGRYRLHS